MQFLIAHQNPGGGAPAQATVEAKTEAAAKHRFSELHPERQIIAVGILGHSGE